MMLPYKSTQNFYFEKSYKFFWWNLIPKIKFTTNILQK